MYVHVLQNFENDLQKCNCFAKGTVMYKNVKVLLTRKKLHVNK